MVKETQQRLIRALRTLRDPSGSTLSAIIQVVNEEEPQIRLKEIVKTLLGCLKTGIMTRCADRIRLKHSIKSFKKDEDPPLKRDASADKMSHDFSYHETTPLPDAPLKIRQKCGPKPKPKAKPKPKCPKPKPKCPKPKPKKKPKCPKPKPKPKPKCPKPKPKPKKPKIQPYCKKPPKACRDHSNMGDY